MSNHNLVSPTLSGLDIRVSIRMPKSFCCFQSQWNTDYDS